MENNQITVTVYGGFDGGLVIYESTQQGENRLVFGGNLEEANKYLHRRMADLLVGPEPGLVEVSPLPRSVARSLSKTLLADKLVAVE
jgi:hypothetical protein